MSTIAETCPWPLAGLLAAAIAVGLQWVDNLPLGATGAVAISPCAGEATEGLA